jgi:predicted metalloenzyme YecM
MKIEDIIGDYHAFVEQLIEQVRTSDIDTSYPIDHLCYRVASQENYVVMRDKLATLSNEVATTTHNEREFSIFKLKEALRIGDHTIPVVELPSPAPSNTFKDGLEHIEMVVDVDFDVFCMENEPVLWGKSDDGSTNPTVYITYTGIGTVKFHPISLDKVVEQQGDKFTPVS